MFDVLVSRMAPESFFHTLTEAQLNVAEALIESFNANAPEPNAVHRACGSLIRQGASLWTTNYDTLVEEACAKLNASPVVWSLTDATPPSGFKIAKPHGSLPARVAGKWSFDPDVKLIFETTQLLADLDRAWADALLASTSDKGVVLVGYSGADTDIAPHLRDAIGAASWVKWFATPREEGTLLRRFDLNSRTGPVAEPALVLNVNPGEAFLEWLANERLIAHAESCPPNLDPSLAGFDDLEIPRLARADLLANLGLSGVAVDLYRETIRSRRAGFRDRSVAALRIARKNALRLRRRRVAASAIRATARLPGSTAVTAISRRLAAEDSRTSDVWPTTETLRTWFEAKDQRNYRGIGLGLIRRLRYEGRLAEARALAESLLSDARFANPSPSHVASFSFQLTETLRMQGNMPLAFELIDRGFSRLLGTSLVLWEEFEQIACRIQCFDAAAGLDVELLDLGRAFSKIEEPFAQETVAMAHAVHLRQQGHHASALSLLMLLVEATRSTSPLLHDASKFHVAETLRLIGDVKGATRVLETIHGHWYLHGALVKVLQTMLEPSHADAERRLREAYEEFIEKGCPWGSAIVCDVSAAARIDIGLSTEDVVSARDWFTMAKTRSYSSDPRGWTFSMI